MTSTLISFEYPASLLRGWKLPPVTVDDSIIYQFHFSVVNFCSKLNCLGLLSPLTEFRAVARTYPVACSGVRQRNFDLIIYLTISVIVYN